MQPTDTSKIEYTHTQIKQRNIQPRTQHYAEHPIQQFLFNPTTEFSKNQKEV